MMRRRILAFLKKLYQYAGSIVYFVASAVIPLESCIVTISPVQSGSGIPSPDNIRPISGWTGCNITVANGDDVTDPDYDATVYSVTWLTEAGTVYGGTFDSKTGKLTITKAYELLNDSTKWGSYSGTIDFIYDQNFSNRKIYANSYDGLMCSYYEVNNNTPSNTARWVGSSAYKFGFKSSTLTLAQIQQDATAGNIAICYELATPIEFTLSALTINTLAGNNVMFADCGNIDISFYDN